MLCGLPRTKCVRSIHCSLQMPINLSRNPKVADSLADLDPSGVRLFDVYSTTPVATVISAMLQLTFSPQLFVHIAFQLIICDQVCWTCDPELLVKSHIFLRLEL